MKKVLLFFTAMLILTSQLSFANDKVDGSNPVSISEEINKLTLENEKLKLEISQLEELLQQWKDNLIRKIEFPKNLITIERTPEKFILKIITNDIGDTKYEEILTSFIDVVKSDSDTEVVIAGRKDNLDVIHEFMEKKKLSDSQYSFNELTQDEGDEYITFTISK